MVYSIYIEKEQLIEEAKKQNKSSYFFIESYLDFLSKDNEFVNFLEFLSLNKISLPAVYNSYCLTENKHLRAYLLSLPRIKYDEINNLIQPNAFDLKTYEHHGWNQAGYGFFISELNVLNYSKFFQLVYQLVRENSDNIFNIDTFLKDNNILENSFNEEIYNLFELNFIKK